MGAAGKSEEATVSEHVSVFQVRVPEESVARLLEVHSGAIAEAQRLCPELVPRSSCASMMERGSTYSLGAMPTASSG